MHFKLSLSKALSLVLFSSAVHIASASPTPKSSHSVTGVILVSDAHSQIAQGFVSQTLSCSDSKWSSRSHPDKYDRIHQYWGIRRAIPCHRCRCRHCRRQFWSRKRSVSSAILISRQYSYLCCTVSHS
ncbi:hypothetical protein SISSUDRAFT_56990 [Sistotremastrum suecicum HHB10207 ss-3]|uniref:Uncharacterized protein n=1 Tax=Sistotremastrum suecicum HHB10207 ss-3 TaxID=1314776 RepID=A0A166BMB6_9AGAM|nr:hypothetical protein SISSUDRAFT_56990 [Sistotremastrum suecicum HHB10207 ss-3]